MKNNFLICAILLLNFSIAQFKPALIIDKNNDTLNVYARVMPSNAKAITYKLKENSVSKVMRTKNIKEVVFASENTRNLRLIKKQAAYFSEENETKTMKDEWFYIPIDSTALYEAYTARAIYYPSLPAKATYYVKKKGDEILYEYYTDFGEESKNKEFLERTFLNLFENECPDLRQKLENFELNNITIVLAAPMLLKDCQ